MTQHAYSPLDLVVETNYNGGKKASFQYNKVGDLVQMEDWTGKTSFEVDLLNRITATNDRLGKRVEYTYDSVGNQVKVGYPDGTAATKEFDLVHNLTSVTEVDNRKTTYAYDGMRRVTHMSYPDGWQEDYTYDSIGQSTSILDTDPTGKDMKQQKNKFEYDDCGNMTYEYMRGNGTGEATVETRYTYDELHQVLSAKESYGNKWRTYQYDSLGNLTWEQNSNNVTTDYKLNNLNQVTVKSSDGWKTSTTYTHDDRGNLVLEQYGKNKKTSDIGVYTYDETNKMVKGVNANAESSSYLYNGLDALVEQTWVVAKNGYGYHDVDADESVVSALPIAGLNLPFVSFGASPQKDNNGKKPSDKPTGSDVKKTSTIVKQFVIDYTVETMDPLMEHEVNGLDYRYVYGNQRLSVNITGIENGAGKLIENGNQVRLYYHQDLRGTVDYLTSPMSGKVESWTHYNEWGEITHNAVLKCGQRELDLVKNYTGHEFDAVLNQYYAKARMYDAENRRFTSVDPILDASSYDIQTYVKNSRMLVQYLYVVNNPLIFIDSLGMFTEGDQLKKGDTNNTADVTMLQIRLAEMGFYKDKVDGSFGDNTLDAVNAYKSSKGLWNSGEYEGVVGQSTWDLLRLPVDYDSAKSISYVYYDPKIFDTSTTEYTGYKYAVAISNALTKEFGSKEKVVMVPLMRSDGFVHQWNVMPDDVNTVVTFTHANSGVITFDNGVTSGRVDLQVMENLQARNIRYMFLLGCNLANGTAPLLHSFLDMGSINRIVAANMYTFHGMTDGIYDISTGWWDHNDQVRQNMPSEKLNAINEEAHFQVYKGDSIKELDRSYSSIYGLIHAGVHQWFWPWE